MSATRPSLELWFDSFPRPSTLTIRRADPRDDSVVGLIGLVERQPQRHFRALAGYADDIDSTAPVLHDLLHGGHAQACPAHLRRKERLEDLAQDVGRHARPR